MHAELLSALAAFRRFLNSNHEIRFQDESLSRELADLDGQIRLFSDRLKLQFPDVPMPETSPGIKPFKPFGYCQVPHFKTYNDISEVPETHGRTGTVSADPVRCFLLSDEWESAFNTFVSMVEADKAALVPANVETPAGGNAGEGADDDKPAEAQWLSPAQAEKLSGINRGTIGRAVQEGKIKSNGKTGKGKLKVDSADFNRWHLERANRSQQTESQEQVEKLFEKVNSEGKRNNR